jgi:uncharacterized membrane protein/protein-disulfide isomerase
MLKAKTKSQIKSLPFPAYFFPFVFLAAVGLADSIYLAISHYRNYVDIGYSSFCAISKSINCDTVSQSPYSIFMGVPVPIWGIVGYTLVFLLLAVCWSKKADKKRGWSLLFFITLAFSIYSVVLSLISTFYIRSHCIMCILGHGINFALLYLSWLIRKRFETIGLIDAVKKDLEFLRENIKQWSVLFLPFVLCVLAIFFFTPAYWNLSLPKVSSQIPTGITENGYPWIGAEEPIVTITEFADYQCFQCKKSHFYLRQLVNKYPQKIRLVHRHFPMDHKFNPLVKERYHVRSGTLAIFAEFALTQDRFWEMNDVLFRMPPGGNAINILKLANSVGLDYRMLAKSRRDAKLRYRVKHDIATGIKLGIDGTPSYLVNDKVYVGALPADILADVLE